MLEKAPLMLENNVEINRNIELLSKEIELANNEAVAPKKKLVELWLSLKLLKKKSSIVCDKNDPRIDIGLLKITSQIKKLFEPDNGLPRIDEAERWLLEVGELRNRFINVDGFPGSSSEEAYDSLTHRKNLFNAWAEKELTNVHLHDTGKKLGFHFDHDGVSSDQKEKIIAISTLTMDVSSEDEENLISNLFVNIEHERNNFINHFYAKLDAEYKSLEQREERRVGKEKWLEEQRVLEEKKERRKKYWKWILWGFVALIIYVLFFSS